MTSRFLKPLLAALVLLCLAWPAVAQAPQNVTTDLGGRPKPFSGAPTSSCGPQDTAVDTTSGDLYACGPGATYMLSAGGGRSGRPSYDVKAFGASGSGKGSNGSNGGAPVVSVNCTAGNPVVTLGAANDFKNGQYVMLPCYTYGGAVSINTTPVQIVSGGGTTSLTLSVAPTQTTSSFNIYHDDTPAIQAALNACTNAGGGKVFLPPAPYDFGNSGYQLGSGPIYWHGGVPQGGGIANGGSCELASWSAQTASIAEDANFWKGPGIIFTWNTASNYVGSTFTGAALLTGTGNSFKTDTNAGSAFLDFMDDPGMTLNGLSAFTAEGTFSFPTTTCAGNRDALITSSGKRDSKVAKTNGFFLERTNINGGCKARFELTTSNGFFGVVGVTNLTANTNHHIAGSYDGATLRVYLDGSLEASTAVTGTLQIGLPGLREEEAVKLGGSDNAGFPYGGVFDAAAITFTADGIRISANARYTGSTYTVPTAKWSAPDGNTIIQCDFDAQTDIYTICRRGTGGQNPGNIPVYLPVHYGSNCGGGADVFHVDKLSWNAPHSWFVMPATDVTIEDVVAPQLGWNGIYLGNCSFHQHINRVWLDGSQTTRYLIASDNGIYHWDNIRIGNAGYGIIAHGNGLMDNIFSQPGGVNNIIPMLIGAKGDQTIGGVNPNFVLNEPTFDIENGAISGFVTALMLDGLQTVTINGGDIEDQQALSTAPALQFQGTGTLILNSVGLRSGDSAAGQIHVTDAAKIFAFGVQNAGTPPIADGGMLTVCGGAGTGSLSGCAVGRPLANSNITLSAGWGTTATVTATTGFSNQVTWTVNATGTGQAANPTMTITWPATAWATAPGCIANENAGTPLAQVTMTAPTTASVVLTWNGLPLAGNSYTFFLHCAGQS